jgi:hypothetical protein
MTANRVFAAPIHAAASSTPWRRDARRGTEVSLTRRRSGNGRAFSQPGAISSGFENKLATIIATRVAGDLDGTPENRHLIDEPFPSTSPKSYVAGTELT